MIIGSGKTTILEGITKGFVPVLRTINAEAMKECNLANKDMENLFYLFIDQEVKKPKALGDIRGASYIYPILWRFSLIRVSEVIEKKMGKQR